MQILWECPFNKATDFQNNTITIFECKYCNVNKKNVNASKPYIWLIASYHCIFYC